MHETWKGTKKLYYEYLNPPASIDYDDSGDLDDSEILLARNLQAVDVTLTKFERYMMNQDRPPSQDSVNALFERFPWVSGVAAIGADGEVLAQQPANIKQLDYTRLLETEPVTPRGLRALVQSTAFGPEVLLGAPVFDGSELQGLFIAHFDMRMLLDGVPDPGNLIITSPEGLLWAGAFGGTPLDGRDWAEIVRHDTGGVIEDGQGKFHWLCRYLGNLPLIFASPFKDNAATLNPAQLEALRDLGIRVPDPAPEPIEPSENPSEGYATQSEEAQTDAASASDAQSDPDPAPILVDSDAGQEDYEFVITEE